MGPIDVLSVGEAALDTQRWWSYWDISSRPKEQVSMESHRFEADVRQILHLVTHSLYSDREIFLRELVSNASDALDRARFLGLQRDDLLEANGEPCIRLSVDVEAGTLTIEDDGVGLTRDEAIEHLGTIARSGTSAFAQALKDKGENPEGLIGQFGVGFYSAFMVADKVVVESRSALPDEAPIRWTSEGGEGYELVDGDREHRGTRITLNLREDARDFADTEKIRHIIHTHSDFVPWPIQVAGEQANQAKSLWTQSPTEVSDEAYNDFYKHICHDWQEPMFKLHIRAEGTLEFSAILFIPAHRPFELDRIDFKVGMRLYQKGVKVLDHADALLPRFLRFVVGVVDAPGLDLNLSREILQQTPVIQAIRKQISKKLLKLLKTESEANPEVYETFWNEFGHILKEGMQDTGESTKSMITGLLRYPTTQHTDELRSLAQVKLDMGKGTDTIWYYTSVDRARITQSPVLEGFKKREEEVLLMSDPVDEWVVLGLSEYEGTPLKSVMSGDMVDEADEDDPIAQAAREQASPLVTWMGELLGEEVAEVRLSSRLTDSPSILVDQEGAMSANMARILKAANQEMGPSVKRVLELNPEHAMVKTLAKLNIDGVLGLEPFARLLLDHAEIAEGRVGDPAGFAGRLEALMQKAAESMDTKS
jgi:molecular chaperone HtpG